MIQNISQLKNQFTHGQILLDIANHVFKKLQPNLMIEAAVSLQGSIVTIQGQKFDLKGYRNIYVVGAGKATYGMAEALYALLGKHITDGYINVPPHNTFQNTTFIKAVKNSPTKKSPHIKNTHPKSAHSISAPKKSIGPIQVNVAGHPYPTASGLTGARKILDLVKRAGPDDLVICLISGGGSSLLPLPISGITLEEKTALSKRLMQKSADIFELNAVRKHLSAIKGGQLAEAAAPAQVISLIVSDVLGDALDVVASGPTVPDSSTIDDALEVLHRYKVGSARIQKLISAHETPKALTQSRVHNFLIGNNQLALEIVAQEVKKAGLHPMLLTSCLRGEAKEVAQVLTAIAQEVETYNRPVKRPAVIIAGGETTVKVLGKGRGGRNQELVLAAVPFLTKTMSIVSLATDGVDGVTPTPVAGAMADGGVAEQCVLEDINYHDYLYSNNSFDCLKRLGCLLHTGPTGTNVGDVVLLLVR